MLRTCCITDNRFLLPALAVHSEDGGVAYAANRDQLGEVGLDCRRRVGKNRLKGRGLEHHVVYCNVDYMHLVLRQRPRLVLNNAVRYLAGSARRAAH